jgi:hypothetical protein
MAEIVLTTEDLVVLGGPDTINVEVDFGPQGDRGSRIYVGNGKPDNVDIGQIPNIFDVYINLLPSSDEYLNIYQYMEVLGTNQWETISRLNFNNYSEKTSIDFNSEINYVFIPTSFILSNPSYIGNLNASNFNVQATFETSAGYPISSAIKTELIPASGLEVEKLKITFYSKEFNGTNWVTPDGSRTANISISVV